MRRELMGSGVAARGVAFVSTDIGEDLCRLAQADEVALLLIDGRRPLLGEGVPRGDVGEVLREAPCDVGVLVAKEEDDVVPGAGSRRCGAVRRVPSTTGRRSSSERGSPPPTGRRSSCSARRGRPRSARRSRACSATPACSCSSTRASTRCRWSPSRVARAWSRRRAGAGLLVVGLSERWRDEGLGSDPLGDRQGGASPRAVRAPRRAARSARAEGGRHSLRLVGGGSGSAHRRHLTRTDNQVAVALTTVQLGRLTP